MKSLKKSFNVAIAGFALAGGVAVTSPATASAFLTVTEKEAAQSFQVANHEAPKENKGHKISEHWAKRYSDDNQHKGTISFLLGAGGGLVAGAGAGFMLGRKKGPKA